MTIEEMHQLFRVVGQQMGMQTIRAILPEEIDVFLNMAIDDKIKQVLLENVLTDSNKVLVGNAKIGNINFFRTLYKKETITISSQDVDSGFYTIKGVVDLSNKMLITSVNVKKDPLIYSSRNCRIIDVDKVKMVLNDYCNQPSKEYPICYFISDENDLNVIVVSGKVNKDTIDNAIEIVYIKNPNKVSLEDNIDCDLPDYTHNEIVQLAVQKYFNSVGSTTHNVE